MDRDINPAMSDLSPLPYQIELCDYLKTEERELWNWFASHKVRAEQAEAVRLDLLKSTYRIERQSQPALYEIAADVTGRMSLDVPVTIYQAQHAAGLNASLAYLPDEAHIIFHGPVSERLGADELRALFAHELGHLWLWQGWDGDFLVLDQILAALTYDQHAQLVHFATARLSSLYTEVFCDRCSLWVVRDPLVVIAMLVKIETGVTEVDAASYLRQAEEVFSRGGAKAADLSHPEACIRARAVKLLQEGEPTAIAQIEEMIQGGLALADLDLLGQRKLAALTRRLVDALVAREWMQSDAVLAHARMFFDDYAPPAKGHQDDNLARDIETRDGPLADYYCYVLLDFVTADRDLEEAPIAAALSLTDQLGLKDRFAEVAARELRLRKKQLETIDREREQILARATGEHTAIPRREKRPSPAAK